MKLSSLKTLGIAVAAAVGIAAPTAVLGLTGYSVRDMSGRECVASPRVEYSDKHVFYHFKNNCDRDLRLLWDYQSGDDSNGVIPAFAERKVTAGIENPLVTYSVEAR